MQLQSLFYASLSAFELSGVGFFVTIAILACLLGVELACTFILINKMLHARQQKQEREQREKSFTEYHNYGVAFFALGAIPQITYLSLSILAGFAAVVTIVFAVVLIVFRVKGYTFISAKDALELERLEQEAETRSARNFSKPATVLADTEEQRQDAYTELPEQPLQEENHPFSVFEEPIIAEFPVEEESQEPVADALVSEENGLVSVVRETSSEDAGQPYKIVEKIITETQKEVIREVPSAPQNTVAAEQLMEKLTDFLDYELQKRKESDLTESDGKGDDSILTFAEMDAESESEELDEEEEDDLDDGKADEDDDYVDEEPESEERFTGNERIIGFDEKTGCYIVAHYNKSFEAKLHQARPCIKQYYSEIKNELLSYTGNKSRISWKMDSISNERTPIAKINVKTNMLELYLALDPDSLEDSVYRGKNVGEKKKYADTPFLYKLRTPRKFKWAMELVQRTCEEHGLSPIDIEKVDYEALYPFESTETLVSRKLIKEYIREEKPATSFELDPDHVPQMPFEDGSVVPANANFSWELDNDNLPYVDEPADELVEEESVAEETLEEEAQPEPVVVTEESSETESQPEPAVADPDLGVVRETVKVTEMRYTERYYADASATFEQIVTTEEPITTLTLTTGESVEEVNAENAEEPVEEAPEEVAADFAEESAESTLEEDLPWEENGARESIPASSIIAELAELSEQNTAFIADEPAEEENDEAEELFFPEIEETNASVEIAYENEADDSDVYESEIYLEIPQEEPEVASKEAVKEKKAPITVDTGVAVIDICAVIDSFEDGDTVNLAALIEKGLVLPSATSLKIYATGTLNKRVTVEANHFTLDAIYAISESNGETSMLY